MLKEIKLKEVPSITKIATTTVLAVVKNKIPNVSNLIDYKITDYKIKIIEIENKITTDHDNGKYITAQRFNKLTSENFTTRRKQAHLGSKNNIANFVKKTVLIIKQKVLFQIKMN